jgi:hypothetical protein
MQEICQSGSEGGAKDSFVPTPISAQGFNPGKHPRKAFRPERARDHVGRMRPIATEKEEGIC